MLRLTSFETEEHRPDYQFWKMDPVAIDNYNLIIGRNGSGKSQFFNRLEFLKIIHSKSGETKRIATTAQFRLGFVETETSRKIQYDVTVSPNQEIDEKITDLTSNKTLFDSIRKVFFNEQTQKEETQLFPRKHSVTKLIGDADPKYPTISAIGDFFDRLHMLRTDRYNSTSLTVGGVQLIPDAQMQNLGAVVLEWKKSSPVQFANLLTTYKSFFFEIEDLIPVTRAELPVPILGFVERHVKEQYSQADCSMGMMRILGILALSFSVCGPKKLRPSMIVIDEIDNGLDFENVGGILDFIKSQSDEIQFLFSSHSPVTCNFIEPKFWRVMGRKGVHVQVKVPTETKETMELIKTARMSNWDLYHKHIAKSKLYSVN